MGKPKVLLINNNRLVPPVAPLALDYLGAALEAEGIEPFLADLAWAGEPFVFLDEAIRENGPFTLAAVTVRNLDDSSFSGRKFFLPDIKELVAWLKQEYRLPVVLGGCGFSIMPAEVMKYCGADYGVWGDGEETLAHLALRLHRGMEVASLNGLLYFRGGAVKFNSPRFASLPEMDYLSRRSLVDNYSYFTRGGQGNLETKRGCDGTCIYCADPLAKGKTRRFRQAHQVVEELQNLLEMGIDCFHFCDPEFNRPIIHAEEICKALIKSGLSEKISWYAYCSPLPFTDKLANLMKTAGCAGINFGVDSGDEEMLFRLGRVHGREDLRRMAQNCHRYDMPFMVDLLLGGPGEDRVTVENSINLVKELDPLAAGMALGLRVYRDTPLEKIVRAMSHQEKASSLHGSLEGNDNFLQPVYYLSPRLGEDAAAFVNSLVGEDPRFFSLDDPREDRDYSYTENRLLLEAIENGQRGAYWHILHKLRSS